MTIISVIIRTVYRFMLSLDRVGSNSTSSLITWGAIKDPIYSIAFTQTPLMYSICITDLHASVVFPKPVSPMKMTFSLGRYYVTHGD